MKIKNVIFENKQYFETIGKIHKSDQLSVMDAYRINRLVKKLNELNEEYDELKKKIFTQYGTPGKEEGTIEVGSENREAFAGEYNDLISIEHDLETEMLVFPSKLEDGFSAAGEAIESFRNEVVKTQSIIDIAGAQAEQIENQPSANNTIE
ncbi:hypothetical protein HX837_07875 [Marine Group I thaumarchaeote]|uniref:Uncharacterized protein n=1 Tax=Marine Group I thaumarchaeote TaxID=2511932 RepID=A0A7K4MRU8_9ARCH|nr:hypothetical protein [Marine Group I thaumarchaeote]